MSLVLSVSIYWDIVAKKCKTQTIKRRPTSSSKPKVPAVLCVCVNSIFACMISFAFQCQRSIVLIPQFRMIFKMALFMKLTQCGARQLFHRQFLNLTASIISHSLTARLSGSVGSSSPYLSSKLRKTTRDFHSQSGKMTLHSIFFYELNFLSARECRPLAIGGVVAGQ